MAFRMTVHTEPAGFKLYRGTITFELPEVGRLEFDWLYRLMTETSVSHLRITQASKPVFSYDDIQDEESWKQHKGMKLMMLALFFKYVLRGIIELRTQQGQSLHHGCASSRKDEMAGVWKIDDGMLEQTIEVVNPQATKRIAEFILLAV